MLAGGVLGGGPGAVIKSIQRGTITLAAVATNTATITGVDLPNSTIRFLGCDINLDGAVSGNFTKVYIELTNATTVTATRANNSQTARVNFEVIEYYPGVLKSVQRGLLTLTGAVTNTAAITAVNLPTSMISYLGNSASDNTAGEDTARTAAKVELTSAVLVTGTKGFVTGNVTISYEVLEFY